MACSGRGRDVSYLTPPAQIRTCSITAYGSCQRSWRKTDLAEVDGLPDKVEGISWPDEWTVTIAIYAVGFFASARAAKHGSPRLGRSLDGTYCPVPRSNWNILLLLASAIAREPESVHDVGASMSRG